jgi:hypothetical protein
MIDPGVRLAICQTCDQYGRSLCFLISMGCRRTFTKTLNYPGGICPLNKWDLPSLPTGPNLRERVGLQRGPEQLPDPQAPLIECAKDPG